MTDSEFVLDCLGRGGWWSLNDLLAESFRRRGCGLTVHSRVSDLRAQGHRIEWRKTGRRGDGSQYRLLTEGGRKWRTAETDRTVDPSQSRFLTLPPSVSEPVQLELVPETRGAYWEAA